MPTSTNTQSNSAGISNRAIGRIVTTSASAAALTLDVGFVPRRVIFHNLTDRLSEEWLEGMAADSALHTAVDGVQTLITSNGVTVSGNTFTLTATTMVASKTFGWVAEG